MSSQAFQFANPEALWSAILILVFYFLGRRLQLGMKAGDNKLMPFFLRNKTVPTEENSKFSPAPSFPLLIAGLLLALALMRPQWGYEEIASRQEGIDIVIAIDLSASMLAEDVKPNRLAVAKRKISDLLAMLTGDRIALISFAGTAFSEAPLTLDHASVNALAKNLTTELAPVPGSNLAAVATISEQLLTLNKENSNISKKGLIIFSDGEFDPTYLEQAILTMKKANIIPILISIGTKKGAPLLSRDGFKRSTNGELVLSKASTETTSAQFAKLGGISLESTIDKKDLESSVKLLTESISSSEREGGVIRRWNEYFTIPLAGACLIMIYAWGLTSYITKSPLGLSLLILLTCLSSPASADLESADKAFNNGDFETAEKKYRALQNEENIDQFHVHTGLANTLYRKGQFKEALSSYEKAVSSAKTSQDISKALFNAANALAQLGQLETAANLLKKAEEQNPKDPEIQKNLDYIQKLIDKQEKNEEQKEKSQEEEKDPSSESKSGKGNGGQDKDKKDPKTPEQTNKDSSEEPQQGKGQSDQNQSKNKAEPDSDQNDKKPESKQPSEKAKEEAPKSPEPQAQEKSPTDGEGKPLDQNPDNGTNSQSLSQLESLQESNNAKIQFRYKKGLQQLHQNNLPESSMDW